MQAIPPEIVLKIVSYLKSKTTFEYDIIFTQSQWSGLSYCKISLVVTHDDSDVVAAKSLRVAGSDFAYAYTPEYIHVNVGGDFMRGSRITLIRYNTRIGWNYLRLAHAHVVYERLCKRREYMGLCTTISVFELMIDWFKRDPLQILNSSLTEIEMRKYHTCMRDYLIVYAGYDYGCLYPNLIHSYDIEDESDHTGNIYYLRAMRQLRAGVTTWKTRSTYGDTGSTRDINRMKNRIEKEMKKQTRARAYTHVSTVEEIIARMRAREHEHTRVQQHVKARREKKPKYSRKQIRHQNTIVKVHNCAFH